MVALGAGGMVNFLFLPFYRFVYSSKTDGKDLMAYIQSTLPSLVASLCVLFLMALSFAGWGRLITRNRLKCLNQSLFVSQCECVIGMGFFSAVGMIIAMLAQFNFNQLVILIVSGILIGLRNKACGQYVRTLFRMFNFREKCRLYKISMIVLWGSVLVSFVGSQAPAIGNDSLAYHLHFARVIADTGALPSDLTHGRAFWPSGMGILFATGLKVFGMNLAKALAWFPTMTLLISIPAVCRILIPESPRASLFALLLVLGSPIILMQSIYAYVDIALSLYIFMAFVVLVWNLKNNTFKQSHSWIIGLLLGSALAVKIYVLIPIVVLFIAAGLVQFRKMKRMILDLSLLGPILMGGALMSAGWYLRSWIACGNPVYPFMAKVFGSGYTPRMVGFSETSKTLGSFLMFPWDLGQKVDVFGGEPLGILSLALIPVGILFFRKTIDSKIAAIFAGGMLIASFQLIQHSRFLIVIVPFLAIVFGYAASEYTKIKHSTVKAGSVILAGLFLTHLALANYYPLRTVKGGLGLISADDYLQDHERTFPIMKKIQGEEGVEILLSIGEPRLFYSPKPIYLFGFPFEVEAAKRGISASDMIRSLGVTHVLTRGIDKAQYATGVLSLRDTKLNLKLEELWSQKRTVEGDVHSYRFWKVIG